jgi:hypothetical protein
MDIGSSVINTSDLLYCASYHHLDNTTRMLFFVAIQRVKLGTVCYLLFPVVNNLKRCYCTYSLVTYSARHFPISRGWTNLISDISTQCKFSTGTYIQPYRNVWNWNEVSLPPWYGGLCSRLCVQHTLYGAKLPTVACGQANNSQHTRSFRSINMKITRTRQQS